MLSRVHSSGLRIDAFLSWAMQSDVHLFDPLKSDRCVLLVQFDHRIDDTTYNGMIGSGMWCCEFYKGYSYATVTVAIALLDRMLSELQALGALYCELGSPDAPPEVKGAPSTFVATPGPETVIGIIDDGCPFAHQKYRPGNGSSPSVRYLWDQGGDPTLGTVPGDYSSFQYGAVYTTQLDTILEKATTPQGVVNEDSAYALTTLPSLRTMVSHGSQVMSHAAGFARPIEGRPPPPPLTGRTDIAFVQLPPCALDNPTGLWLNNIGLDCLHAIRHYARKMVSPPAKKVLINLSYGPQTGPHNGSFVVEGAIREMRETAKAKGYILRVVLPSGNTHLLQAHAEFDLACIGVEGSSIDWYVSPDSQVHSVLDIWMPTDVAPDQIDVRVESPAGDVVLASNPPVPANPVVSINPSLGPAPDDQLQIVIAIAPTARASTDAAPALAPPPKLATPGRWRVTIKTVSKDICLKGVAHAYLARSDPNMGRPLHGRSGYLDSPDYGDKCGAFPTDQLNPDPPGMGAAEVFARGCLNGAGTGTDSLVASGFRLRDQLPAPYSSGGGTRGPRAGPNWAYPTEECRVLAGLLGRGNRSGVMMRFSGTSIAAPQLVRELAATPGGRLSPSGRSSADDLVVQAPLRQRHALMSATHQRAGSSRSSTSALRSMDK